MTAPLEPERLLAGLRARRDEMVHTLDRLVRCESPSHDPAAHDAVLAILAEHLEALDFVLRRRRGRATGGWLYGRPAARRRGAPRQILLGHADTVWPHGALADMPASIVDGAMYGPGAYDTKAGLTIVLFALEALAEAGHVPAVTPVVFVNTDEEISSPESAPWVVRLAQGADRVLVVEPSLGPEGRLKTARKGVGRFRVRVEGRAAHAGLDPESGVSAIRELSHVIQSLFALNDPGRGIAVNVGTVEGGLRPNVIAPTSEAWVDVRVATLDDAERVEAALRALAPTLEGARLHVEGHFTKLPMEHTPGNRALWERARVHGDALGLGLAEGSAGGGSDGNTTSLHAPTLDGLGGVGDGAHAAHEHVRIDSLPERAALLALLVADPPLEIPC